MSPELFSFGLLVLGAALVLVACAGLRHALAGPPADPAPVDVAGLTVDPATVRSIAYLPARFDDHAGPSDYLDRLVIDRTDGEPMVLTGTAARYGFRDLCRHEAAFEVIDLDTEAPVRRGVRFAPRRPTPARFRAAAWLREAH